MKVAFHAFINKNINTKTVEDYLPYLFGIVDCLEGGQLKLKKEFGIF